MRSNVPVVRGTGNMGSGDECVAAIEDGSVRLPAIMKVRFVLHIICANTMLRLVEGFDDRRELSSVSHLLHSVPVQRMVQTS